MFQPSARCTYALSWDKDSVLYSVCSAGCSLLLFGRLPLAPTLCIAVKRYPWLLLQVAACCLPCVLGDCVLVARL